MSSPDFSSLPPDYQHILRVAQERLQIETVPLKQLLGGRTGARLYLVSVSSKPPQKIEHYVLKLDRVHRKAKSDEIQQHKSALSQAPPEFARQHMADLVFSVEHQGVIAIFYTIAGQSLHQFRPLAGYKKQRQQENIFLATNDYLLKGWNEQPMFEQAVHPQNLLTRWLSYRLKPEGNLGRFLDDEFNVPQEVSGLLIQGQIFPNPITYGRDFDRWGDSRPIDAILGFQHGDLNIGNLLAKFASNGQDLDGYFLIDFALFKSQMPLLFDLRYLEMSYLLRELDRADFPKWVDFVTQFAEQDTPDPHQVPVELAGACGVINAGRKAFQRWVQASHPSLQDDLWGQCWLAGVAAGLNYCNKTALPTRERLAGLIFAAAHLKRYLIRFGVPMPVEVSLLYDANQPGAIPHLERPLPGSDGVFHNLPVQPTTFIGRQEEAAAVREILLRDETRLLTLIGPGGTGKTRLGLRVASELGDRFHHGVFFVPLADIEESQLVVSKIAQSLGVREGGRLSLLENIQNYLRERRSLLVLDNFEHVVDAALVVAELLKAAPHLKVLTTSRTTLRLQGEYEYNVPPLKLPDPGSDRSPERLVQSEAVQLFVERAKAASSRFTLSEENARQVAEICQRLDGLPLAIELAAARVRLLPPQIMLVHLNDRLGFLSGGARDLPARQQTLRNAIEWSYDLLEQDEKTLFARLGVFVGGFTLEAAQAVCNPDKSLDALGGVETLLNNSLLREEETRNGRIRFRMLETIREYALDKLEISGETETLREQHAGYFTEKMGELTFGNQLFSAEGNFWLNWLDEEYENLRAVLSWSQTTQGRAWHGIVAIGSLFWYWYRRGYFREGRRWSEWVLSTPDAQDPNPTRGFGLLFNGIMAMWQGDLAAAQNSIDEGLVLWQHLEEVLGLSTALLFKGFLLLNQGRDADARNVLERALELYQETGDLWQQADTLVHLGNAALGLGDMNETVARLQQAQTVSKEVGDKWLIAFLLNNYGEVARVEGDYNAAEGYYERGKALLIAEGDKGGDLARLIHSLGYVAQRKGEPAKAERQFRKSLAMFRKFGNQRGILECLAGLAGLWAERGDPKRGAKLLSASQSLMNASGHSWWPADRVEFERNKKTIQTGLDAEAFSSAWVAGEDMTLEAAISYAAHTPE